MRSRTKHEGAIFAAIGPSIGAGNFEVGIEVLEEFRRVFGSDAPAQLKCGGKAHVDLREAIVLQLRGCGFQLDQIDTTDRCTFRDADVGCDEANGGYHFLPIMQRASLYPLLLAIATILVFGRIATNDFTYWDDAGTIHHNPRLNPPTAKNVLWYWGHSELGLYMPVTYTVWGALAAVARLDAPDEFAIALNPWLFHAASLIVHVGSVILVFRILRRLSGREGASFAGALVFALHPLQTEAVAWASGLKDLLCGFFALMAVWEYMKFLDESSQRRWVDYAGAVIAFVLSMLSKPTGMLTPILGGIVAYWGLRRPVKQIAMTLGPWLILSVGCGVLAKIIQPALGVPVTALWTRPLIAGDVLMFYLGKLIAPFRLSVDYGRRPVDVAHSWVVYVAWIVPAMLAIAIWRVRESQPLAVAAGLIFLGGLLLVLGLVPFLMQYYSTVTDHYLYLPMLGVALA